MPPKFECIDCSCVCFSRSKEPRCRSCSIKNRMKGKLSKSDYQRQWTMLKKYNLNLLDFETLWLAFKGQCGICNRNLTIPANTQGQQLSSACIDHNHTTGKLRGLLCNGCNKGIGLLKDNKEIVYSAYKWLEGEKQ